MIKWALLNILLAFTTGIIALISASRHGDVDLGNYDKKKMYLAKSIAIYIGIISCLVCLFSEQPMGEYILVADRWTIVLLFLLTGELLTDYFVNKRCHPKDWERKNKSQ